METTAVGRRLRELRRDQGLTLKALSKAARVPISTISDIEHGRSQSPEAATLFALAGALGVDSGYLGSLGTTPQQHNNIVPMHTHRDKPVPLIDFVIGGEPELPTDPYAPGEAESWLYCQVPHSDSTYALKVRGDSMQSAGDLSFPPDSIIFVDPDIANDARSGDLVIARILETGYTTFKQFVRDAGVNSLRPLNPSYPTITQPFEVIAVVIEKREAVKRG